MKNLLYLTIFFLGLLLLWSFRSAPITTKVSGKVLNDDDALRSVKVSILDISNNPLGYYEYTEETGEYTLVFNATEGRRMKLKFEKKGYTTLIKNYTPKKNLRDYFFADIHLIKIVSDHAMSTTYRLKNFNNADAHKIRIYSSQASPHKNYREFSQNEIDHFTFIQKDEFSTDDGGEWYRVSFMVKNTNEEFEAYYFEAHPTKEVSLNLSPE